jgi:hypothetical protein
MSGNGPPTPSGHTVSFTGGGLDIDTTSGPGMSSSGGGRLEVTGAANTIDTSTGSGLVVSGSAITANDVTFQRVSTNGAPNGILLNSTGAAGNLAVTGTGGTCTFATPTCTGGNIANSTDDGISLTSTAGPTFASVNVHDGQDNGMSATTVSALSVDNSIFVDNSDDIATNDEANLRMRNVSGSSSVTNSLFREARVSEVYWTPTTATGSMTWTNNTVGPDNAGELGNGLLLNPTSTAVTTLNVSGGSFTGINGDSLRPTGEDTSATTVNVSGATTFLDSNSGVNFSANDDADLTFDVSGSTFTRHASHALQMIVNDNTTSGSIVRGKALNNVIGNGTADSGSHDANGISYDLEGAADIVLNVSNNTVRNTDTQGIFIQSVRFPSGTPNLGPNVDLHLRDNTVTNIDDNSAFPFGFQHGTQVEARRNSSMCLDIAGNTSTGIGGAEHFRVRQRDASTFRLERLTGNPADPANVASFIAAQNDPGSTASATVATTFTAVADGFCDDVP